MRTQTEMPVTMSTRKLCGGTGILLNPTKLLGMIANYSSRPHNRLDVHNDSRARERNQTVVSFYNQSAIDAAAAKVRVQSYYDHDQNIAIRFLLKVLS